MSNDDNLYNVEKILDRKISNGKVLYKIKWENYPLNQCTWEPEKNLENVKSMVEDFNNNHPMNLNSQEKKKKINTKTLTNKKRKKSPEKTIENNLEKEEREKEKENELNEKDFGNNLEKNQKDENTKNEATKENDEIVKEQILINNYKIDSQLKEVITVKMEDGILKALVAKKDDNGKEEKLFISTEELRKKNPWILIKFYESKIKFN